MELEDDNGQFVADLASVVGNVEIDLRVGEAPFAVLHIPQPLLDLNLPAKKVLLDVDKWDEGSNHREP